jgi:Fe-S-cluster containining protein
MKSDIKRTLNLYQTIDSRISQHYTAHKKQAPCKKGCSSCCSQFFEISELEYRIIEKALVQLPEESQSLLKTKANVMMEIFSQGWPEFYNSYFTSSTYLNHDEAYYQHPQRYLIHLPCIFLSDEGSCLIYEQRPIVCRTTGVSYIDLFNPGSICNVIKKGLFTPLWQADLRNLKADIEAIRWIKDDSQMGVKRQYPMFFYIYNRL